MMMVNNDVINLISGIFSFEGVLLGSLLKLGSTNNNKYLTN
jgi:hypothetical protein